MSTDTFINDGFTYTYSVDNFTTANETAVSVYTEFGNLVGVVNIYHNDDSASVCYEEGEVESVPYYDFLDKSMLEIANFIAGTYWQ